MILIIFIYGLLGMQLFQNISKFHPYYHIYNFETFFEAFLTVFSVITLDNWSYVMQILYQNNNKEAFLAGFYLISGIFIGNYIFLNLFLAILLDGFTEEVLSNNDLKEKIIILPEYSDNEIIDHSIIDENRENLASEIVNLFNNKKRKNRNHSQKSTIIFKNRFNITDRIKQFFKIKLIMFKVICNKCYKSPYFDKFMIILIMITCFKLIFDTYIDWEDKEQLLIQRYSENIDLCINMFFLLEAILKIIPFGFLKYIKDPINQLDFLIVCLSLFDHVANNFNLSAIKVSYYLFL